MDSVPSTDESIIYERRPAMKSLTLHRPAAFVDSPGPAGRVDMESGPAAGRTSLSPDGAPDGWPAEEPQDEIGSVADGDQKWSIDCEEDSFTMSPQGLDVSVLQTGGGAPDDSGSHACSQPQPHETQSDPLASAATDPADDGTPKTTVMLLHIPRSITREDLINVLLAQGLAQKFDFVYLPCNFITRTCHGYAFVNMINEAFAEEIKCKFSGFTGFDPNQNVPCEVIWAKLQGLEMNVEHFRKSPVMRGPAEFRPMLFREDGTQHAFPKTKRRTRKPKMRIARRGVDAVTAVQDGSA